MLDSHCSIFGSMCNVLAEAGRLGFDPGRGKAFSSRAWLPGPNQQWSDTKSSRLFAAVVVTGMILVTTYRFWRSLRTGGIASQPTSTFYFVLIFAICLEAFLFVCLVLLVYDLLVN
jgi:hypothetical protein